MSIRHLIIVLCLTSIVMYNSMFKSTRKRIRETLWKEICNVSSSTLSILWDGREGSLQTSNFLIFISELVTSRVVFFSVVLYALYTYVLSFVSMLSYVVMSCDVIPYFLYNVLLYLVLLCNCFELVSCLVSLCQVSLNALSLMITTIEHWSYYTFPKLSFRNLY